MTAMDCSKARSLLPDAQRGRLSQQPNLELRAHLDTCRACARLDAEERTLSDLLRSRLARPQASPAFRARLAARLAVPNDQPKPAPKRSGWLRKHQVSVPLALAGALAATFLLWSRATPVGMNNPVLREAVNDHLRVLYAAHPIEIENGGLHQVKPWFTGRLDFAPDLAFSGDDEFPLLGGAVGYFIDRKAASFVFKRRLHTISLFVFRAEGLPWPREPQRPMAHVQAQVGSVNGFSFVLWRTRDLGHALVSDASTDSLLQLGSKLVVAR